MRRAVPRFVRECLAGLLILTGTTQSVEAETSAKQPAGSWQSVAPIFQTRCVACHSCYNAPCQLNLQTYGGATRGAAKTNVYDGTRLKSVLPSRLGIDAQSTVAWREKGFFDVLSAGRADQSLLLRLTRLRQQHGQAQPQKQAAESLVCPVELTDPRLDDPEKLQALGMPYGLPALSDSEIDAIESWIAQGAKGPATTARDSARSLPKNSETDVRAWEEFLNASGRREALVSQYIYEHLFLAHLHFSADRDRDQPAGGAVPPAQKTHFFRLVRSRTHCDAGIDEIATRRPADTVGSGPMFYCLAPVEQVIVEKTHIPYALSAAKLERLRNLFLSGDWNVAEGVFKSAEDDPNPFRRFADIPVRARYQFLLDDAHYHIATFIKGPVCNGSSAVNSIQEQFFVFFLAPGADSMVLLPSFSAAAESKLKLPGEYGSDVGIAQDLGLLKRIVDYRESYRRLRADSVRRLRPSGYSLTDIWDGDGDNPNAVLTVFRHYDNAAVVRGAVGDLSKTAFVLDYALFERLVYNLVVDFDVFGNVGHQFLTRVYMDLIRMEAEELFLSFLPAADRTKLRSAWYKGGLLTDIKMNIVFPITNLDVPTGVKFTSGSPKQEFVERVLFERLSPAARGAADPINWRALRAPSGMQAVSRMTAAEEALRKMASIPAVDASPFSRFFPELSLVHLKRADGGSDIYSIVHNRELENVSWIMGEELRLAPQEDTLTIARGVLGAYPDMLFELNEADAPAFGQMAVAIKDKQGFEGLVDRFGIRRTSPNFWGVYDRINALAIDRQPVERGVLDLTRYALEKL